MKTIGALLICYLSATITQISASPAQVVLDLNQLSQSNFRHDILTNTESAAAEFLNDAKKAILKGKSEMQKWFYQGKEYIKQNGLLCADCFLNWPGPP